MSAEQPSLFGIFLGACLVNNFVFAYFLGVCPFLGVSGKLATAARMGAAVTLVMLLSSASSYGLERLITRLDLPYLRLIVFVAVIATSVQLVEMFVRKVSPALFRALGIFLPLITTNCAILGVSLFQTQRGYGFVECLVFALGAGAGFALALSLMAGLRERIGLLSPPDAVGGTALSLVLAGLLSLSFMGFAGLGG